MLIFHPMPCPSPTVLIAEDEEAVKTLAIFAFKAKGYTPLAAGTGEDALALWQAHKNEISLLFTDLSMPGQVSGFDLARQIRSTHPALPIIFTSGDVAESLADDPTLQQATRHLLKPYRPSDLLALVATMLPAAA